MTLFWYTIIKASELISLKEQLQNTIKQHTLIAQDYEKIIEDLTNSDYNDKEDKIALLRKLLTEKLKTDSQVGLEKKTGISQSMISIIINDNYTPKYATIVKYILKLNEL